MSQEVGFNINEAYFAWIKTEPNQESFWYKNPKKRLN